MFYSTTPSIALFREQEFKIIDRTNGKNPSLNFYVRKEGFTKQISLTILLLFETLISLKNSIQRDSGKDMVKR